MHTRMIKNQTGRYFSLKQNVLRSLSLTIPKEQKLSKIDSIVGCEVLTRESNCGKVMQ